MDYDYLFTDENLLDNPSLMDLSRKHSTYVETVIDNSLLFTRVNNKVKECSYDEEISYGYDYKL